MYDHLSVKEQRAFTAWLIHSIIMIAFVAGALIIIQHRLNKQIYLINQPPVTAPAIPELPKLEKILKKCALNRQAFQSFMHSITTIAEYLPKKVRIYSCSFDYKKDPIITFEAHHIKDMIYVIELLKGLYSFTLISCDRHDHFMHMSYTVCPYP